MAPVNPKTDGTSIGEDWMNAEGRAAEMGVGLVSMGSNGPVRWGMNGAQQLGSNIYKNNGSNSLEAGDNGFLGYWGGVREGTITPGGAEAEFIEIGGNSGGWWSPFGTDNSDMSFSEGKMWMGGTAATLATGGAIVYAAESGALALAAYRSVKAADLMINKLGRARLSSEAFLTKNVRTMAKYASEYLPKGSFAQRYADQFSQRGKITSETILKAAEKLLRKVDEYF
jgi:hypothetical protein